MIIQLKKLYEEIRNLHEKLCYEVCAGAENPALGIDLDVWSGRVRATEQIMNEINARGSETESEDIFHLAQTAAAKHLAISADTSGWLPDRKASLGAASMLLRFSKMVENVVAAETKKLKAQDERFA